MNVSELKTIIGLAEPFLIDQDFIPILQHLCFKPHSILAYNDVQAIQLEYKSGLHCAVPGKLFNKLLNTLSVTDVNLELNKSQTELLIGTGRNQIKLPILPQNEFIFEMPDVQGVELNFGQGVDKGFAKCLSTVSHNPTRPERNGITIKVERDHIMFYTTDGVTISTYRVDGMYSVSETEQIWHIMPTFFCERLYTTMKSLSLFPRVTFDETSVLAQLEGHKIFSRLINAEPPKFESAIRRILPTPLEEVQLFPIPTGLIAALTRATLMLQPEKNIKTTTIVAEPDGTLKLSTISDRGVTRDEIETNIKFDGEPLTLYSDPNYLLRGCNLCTYMTLKDGVFVFSNDDRTFYHLISVATEQ